VILNQYEHELEIAVGLARRAGQLIMGYYHDGLPVEVKPGDEPVTAADRAADDLIRAGILEAFPKDGLLTEESEDDLSRLSRERVWIVDPLDGTTEFINETDEFAVQIALAVGGDPVLGVVYQPPTQTLFYAVQGNGAHRVRDGSTTRLQVSTVAETSEMCLVASRSHFAELVDVALGRLGIESVNRFGSVGLKVGQLALGHCDLYLATVVAKEWDICAPHILLKEAGGELTNLCGEGLVYNKSRLADCRGLVGSNGQVHDHIVEVVAEVRAEGLGEALTQIEG
jgi:3'(2'), 5'-bisphosphate nucleotidase